MKKVFLICCLMVLSIFSFASCDVTVGAKFKNYISENTFGLASSMDGKFKVDFKWGTREDPYISNGISAPNINFGVLTAWHINGNMKNHTAKYEITIDNNNYRGDFLVNPFDSSFVVDFHLIPKVTQKFNVNIIAEGKTYKYELNNVLSSGDAQNDEVLKIAENALKKEIKAKVKRNEKYEIYIRLVQGMDKDFKPCWYVSVFTDKGQLFAVVIDPKTKIVLARKV